jgi:transposase-like protein
MRLRPRLRYRINFWQTRSLDPAYPLVLFDAIRVKIREDHGINVA